MIELAVLLKPAAIEPQPEPAVEAAGPIVNPTFPPIGPKRTFPKASIVIPSEPPLPTSLLVPKLIFCVAV